MLKEVNCCNLVATNTTKLEQFIVLLLFFEIITMESSVESNTKYLAVSNDGTVVVSITGELTIEEFENVIKKFKTEVDKYKCKERQKLMTNIKILQEDIESTELKLRLDKERLERYQYRLDRL